MLLIHQAGSVKVGEVVRYTVSYTPSVDRILPTPSHLYVRIKNTSAIPLRAAYLHGPYTIHVCSYPSAFNPNQKLQQPRRDGVPEFEPNLKAGGHWHTKLTIPEDIRERGDKPIPDGNRDGSPQSVKWIIEIASQILFSTSAAVHYELLVSRDERSLDLGFAAVASKGHGEPGQIEDFKRNEESHSKRSLPPKGVYSKAVDLVVEDTATLWNKPTLPQWGSQESQLPTDEESSKNTRDTEGNRDTGTQRSQKQKKLHLVILTHGLHSNVGADMLYLKESIDTAAREAREAARDRRREMRERALRRRSAKEGETTSASKGTGGSETRATGPTSGGQDQMVEDENHEDMDGSDDEQVIVRGFTGNACRTDRGVQYLGKRLAKFVLTTTYPDQPFLPTTRSRTLTGSFLGGNSKPKNKYGTPAHDGSSIRKKDSNERLPYTFTKISFIGHSLGGLVQTYAVAYIHKHSPGFFDKLKPENFVTLASPLLGLSNENPLYVKFALDFGLVGRTGKDLGLTWRAPNIARTGWSAVLSGFGANDKQEGPQEQDPRAKPLLRILPTGPAHQVLKRFRNRTLYSNVVNDGIVPLRTSCLLFLDWDGLDKVDNARRENGLIGTMAAFGWAEITGASSAPVRSSAGSTRGSSSGDEKTKPIAIDDSSFEKPSLRRADTDVPQPTDDQSQDKTGNQTSEPAPHQFLTRPEEDNDDRSLSSTGRPSSENPEPERYYTLPNNPLTDFINYFRPGPGKAHPSHPRKLSTKVAKTYRRAQTIKQEHSEQDESSKSDSDSAPKRGMVTRGDSTMQDRSKMPPPKTSIFDAASDILNPPLPPQSWLIDPSKRSRTIFHDRVYHPEDIPPPPVKRSKQSRSVSTSSLPSLSSQDSQNAVEEVVTMKVEEKIARAYHKGLSWRKVLVRLEPDAHNNMIVRRIFANAYGWDVIKHLCDTHFADTYASNTRDEDEPAFDRAKDVNAPVTEDGEQVQGQTDTTRPGEENIITRTFSETQEAADHVADLSRPRVETRTLASSPGGNKEPATLRSPDSVIWSEDIFDDGDDAEDSDEEQGPLAKFQRFWGRGAAQGRKQADREQQPASPRADSRPQIAEVLSQEPAAFEPHRGIGLNQSQTPPSHSSSAGEAFDPDGIEPLTGGNDAPLQQPGPPRRKSSGKVADIGLKKPPEAHIAGAESSTRRMSVAEQLARSSLENEEGQEKV